MVIFSTKQSVMSLPIVEVLISGQMPRAVLWLVSVLNSLLYDWTVKDESKVTWHDLKRNVVWCNDRIAFRFFRDFKEEGILKKYHSLLCWTMSSIGSHLRLYNDRIWSFMIQFWFIQVCLFWNEVLFCKHFPSFLNTGILCNVMGPILGLRSDKKKQQHKFSIRSCKVHVTIPSQMWFMNK